MPNLNRLLLEAIDHSLRTEIVAAVTGIGPGHTTGWRTLPGCTTAHLLGVTLTLERSGEAPLTLHPGQAFCLAPGLRHCSTVTVGSGFSRWSLFDCLIFGSVPVMSLVDVPLVMSGLTARRLGDLTTELAQTLHATTPGLHHALRRHAQTFTLVSFLLDQGSLRPEAEAMLMHADRLAPVLQHIERHIHSPVSRAGLARVAGLSPSRFHALFRQAMGMSPVAYALTRRLRQASQLLIGSELSIQEIADRLGFADPFYFSRLFKQRMTLSPSRYRTQARLGLGMQTPTTRTT